VQQQENQVKGTLLSAAAAFALAVLMLPGSAQAQCWWDGFTTSCAAPPAPYYAAPFLGTPYAAWNSYDYRNYRYQPDWLPTYPGPRPGH
jgi:hypothetical protein